MPLLPEGGKTVYTLPDQGTDTGQMAEMYQQNKKLNNFGFDVREDFGAVGNGTADDRVAIQAAITAAHARYVATGMIQDVVLSRGVFAVSETPYYTEAAALYGQCSLLMEDGVHLTGGGTLKVKDSAYGPGAFYRCIASRSSGLTNGRISDITVDGNRANQEASLQCDNILLECADNVTVRNVTSIEANGNSILLRGTTSTYATRLKVLGCTVNGANYIGIQSSHFDGLIISGNDVTNTENNAIDIYGEDGSNVCHGKRFAITGNVIDGCNSAAIFLETVRDGSTTGNTVTNSTVGLQVNRINGAPKNLTVSGNTFSDCPTGASLNGDTAGVSVTGNTFAGFTIAGVKFGVGGGNISYYTVADNLFCPANDTTYHFVVDAVQIAFIVCENNRTTSSDVEAFNVYLDAGTNVGTTFEAPRQLEDPGWNSYTPNLQASGGGSSIGNGTLTGRYVQQGRTVTVRIELVLGSTTSLGSGVTWITLPLPPVESQENCPMGGWAYIENTGSQGYYALPRVLGGQRIDLLVSDVSGNGKVTNVTATAPFAFGSTDVIRLTGTYEIGNLD